MVSQAGDKQGALQSKRIGGPPKHERRVVNSIPRILVHAASFRVLLLIFMFLDAATQSACPLSEGGK